MMKRTIAALMAAAALSAAAQSTAADSLNRAVATFMASNFKIAVDNALADLRVTGLEIDTAQVKTLLLDELVTPYSAEAHSAASDYIERAIELKARAESDALLERAAKAPGARILPGGLVLETITPGTGANPTESSVVAIRYAVSLPDGNVFDSIGPEEPPMVTPLAQLTKGMAEGLTHMQAGGNYRLTVPSDLAYGSQGVPGVIPPDCALQFVVELVEIK